MSLKVGIVGLPNVGKSTLFNALTKKAVPAENYPFCTIDPSVGIVALPDDRLDKLARFSHSKKVIPAVVEFVDIAGLVRGASSGEGLGNQFLAHIREVDVIAHVVRVFEDEDIAHVHNVINPLDDIEVVNTELALADCDTLRKRRDALKAEIKKASKEAINEVRAIEAYATSLEQSAEGLQIEHSSGEAKFLARLHLLTLKPSIYVLNAKTDSLHVRDAGDHRYDDLKDFLEKIDAQFVEVDVGVERELSEVSSDEKIQFRRDFGVLDDGLDALIRNAYSLLRLLTYFTTGEKETRAWTIKRGTNAKDAGAAIHSDFRDKFIRAEVIGWKTLLDAGSSSAAREQGLLRAEGKDYLVEDGDVVEFRI